MLVGRKQYLLVEFVGIKIYASKVHWMLLVWFGEIDTVSWTKLLSVNVKDAFHWHYNYWLNIFACETITCCFTLHMISAFCNFLICWAVLWKEKGLMQWRLCFLVFQMLYVSCLPCAHANPFGYSVSSWLLLGILLTVVWCNTNS